MTASPHPRTTVVSPGRHAAWRALVSWEQRKGRASQLLQAARPGLTDREQRLAHELLFGVLRWLGRIDAILDHLLDRPLRKLSPDVRAILRLGVYQLDDDFRAPDHAVVSQSVALARHARARWATGLINATLRRYARHRSAVPQYLDGPDLAALAVRHAHPPWLVESLAPRLGDDLEALLQANNQVPPLTVRVHADRVSRETFLAALGECGIEAEPAVWAVSGVRIRSHVAVPALPGYREGWFTVQDEASQLVGQVSGVLPGEQVLDACAAPGGKTLHLAETVGPRGRVYATDASPGRLEMVREAAERCYPGRVRVAQKVWAGEAGRGASPSAAGGETGAVLPRMDMGGTLPPDWPSVFDRVLADAPCSGLGVVRRHPEIKWRRRAEDIPGYADRQLAILLSLAGKVRPGGTLTYSVCTVTEEETAGVVHRFLAHRSDFVQVDLEQVLDAPVGPLISREGFLTTFPHRDDCDAFFVARLERVFPGT